MGEGDEIEDPQICRDPTWDAPNFINQAVTSMGDCDQSIGKKKNGQPAAENKWDAEKTYGHCVVGKSNASVTENRSFLPPRVSENFKSLKMNGVPNVNVTNGPNCKLGVTKKNEFAPEDQVNGVALKENGFIFPESPIELESKSTGGAGEFEYNDLIDVYKDGVVDGLEVPHGDVRKTIRANMLSVQPNFQQYEWDIKWTHVFMIGFVHIWAVLALPSLFYMKWQTFLLRVFEAAIAGVGVTAGAHRLYCHRSYKAKLPLHLFLLWAYSVAGENTLFDWVRDHRVHHKFSETDADPHNANRGWFFSHCGWLMIRKHPEVLRRGKTVDMSDIVDDPYIAIHTKIFYVLKTLTCHVIPIMIPMMLWDEGFWVSANTMMVRFAFTLNATWSVNSFAHLWGDRPIDKRIFPGENWIVSAISFGEGWHNYHHVFPWDYKAAEWGPGLLNMATIFLDACAWLGLAYDLKEPSKSLVQRTALRHGDGTWTNPHGLEEVPYEPPVAKDHPKAR